MAFILWNWVGDVLREWALSNPLFYSIHKQILGMNFLSPPKEKKKKIFLKKEKKILPKLLIFLLFGNVFTFLFFVFILFLFRFV